MVEADKQFGRVNGHIYAGPPAGARRWEMPAIQPLARRSDLGRSLDR
jgi:carboxylesterase type B